MYVCSFHKQSPHTYQYKHMTTTSIRLCSHFPIHLINMNARPSPFVQWYIATQSFSSPLSMLRSIVYPPLWVGELIDYIYHPMLQLFYQSNNIFPQWLPHQYDARVLWWTDGHRCQDCLSLIDGRYSAGYKPQMPHISSPRWKDKKGKHLNKPSKFAARIVV